ncbi:MOSC domain-containing protein [Nonomuraea terrae]|uniref:MOSC domain-containing protein n=1 Tax=Nonomuraea terrae TaxID=2530383 RepID=A0A4R4YQ01_9ACTN|nr:MOSC and FAD-binding oxidoreductase domain-containing protein [Nonomuraea terrae]TDD46660.1 MOSC domain-containing protein [Nonomuraea terrae]
MTAKLLSVNVGMPKDVSWQGRNVRTGVWKHAVTGPRMARRLNIDGDGQGDLQGHGGEQRAVLVYQIQSYHYWQRYFGRADFEYGQFGENFTVDGLPDDEVCIGDRYRIGEAEFEVTQPRVTCYRVGLRLGEPELPALLVSHHRPGFYLRVLTEGRIQAGDAIVRTRTGPGALTVADIDALLYLPGHDPDTLRRALAVPALSPGWRSSFEAMAAGGPAAPRSEGWTGFRPMRVSRIARETPSVLSLYLEADGGEPLPVAGAGQYLTLRIGGIGDPAPVRSYSLSSPPGAPAYRVSVKREELGHVSRYLHESLRVGAVVEVAAPRGDFVLAPGTGPVLLVSAGIGATPVMAMLHRLATEHAERPVWWIHTTRNSTEHAFAREAHTLLTSLPDAHEHTFYTAAGTGEAGPGGVVHHGRPTSESLRALGVPADATAYLCGPASFMSAVRDMLLAVGLAAGRIHTELFGALAPITPGVTPGTATPPHQPPGEPGTGPLITFARSGLSVRWSPRYRSVLDLADACEVPTRWSCRTGVCHTCATPILAGDVNYSPDPLEPPAAGEVLICCARPEADLVLDL